MGLIVTYAFTFQFLMRGIFGNVEDKRFHMILQRHFHRRYPATEWLKEISIIHFSEVYDSVFVCQGNVVVRWRVHPGALHLLITLATILTTYVVFGQPLFHQDHNSK